MALDELSLNMPIQFPREFPTNSQQVLLWWTVHFDFPRGFSIANCFNWSFGGWKTEKNIQSIWLGLIKTNCKQIKFGLRLRLNFLIEQRINPQLFKREKKEILTIENQQ